VVGLPLVALADRIRHLPLILTAFIGGLGGALLILSPNLLARILDPQVHYAPFSLNDLSWPAAAFVIAAATTALVPIPA
jgi:hypothetical protein